MAIHIEKALGNLSAKLPEYRTLDSTERHIFMFWLITQGMTISGAERPILVGGGAVEFYTCVKFSTGDIDIVAPDKKTCYYVLQSLGFERLEDDKYFVNRDLGALVDVHGSTLTGREKAVELVYRKIPLLLVSPEDCIAERLASYRRYCSSLDLLNAFLITFHNRDRLDFAHLQERIGALDLWGIYREVQRVARELTLHESGVDEAASELIHFMKEGSKPCAF